MTAPTANPHTANPHGAQAQEARQILIVEDEPKIARLVADYLESSGFSTHHLAHGDDVLPWLLTSCQTARQATDKRIEWPALALLDLMLPGTDGLTLCREIRQRWPTLPVIMLTARVEEVDRLLGLELGADDYICKPFSPREVVARVKAVLRRSQAAGSPLSGSDLVLDEEGWRALANGQDLGLTAVEFQLLRVMMHAPGRIFSRDQLMDHMYRDHRIVSERTVDSHVKKLRRKISEVWPEREVIRSVYGVGYKYQPEE